MIFFSRLSTFINEYRVKVVWNFDTTLMLYQRCFFCSETWVTAKWTRYFFFFFFFNPLTTMGWLGNVVTLLGSGWAGNMDTQDCEYGNLRTKWCRILKLVPQVYLLEGCGYQDFPRRLLTIRNWRNTRHGGKKSSYLAL